MKQIDFTAHATITIKPTAPPVLWYNLYRVPPEIRTKQAIKELERTIREVKNDRRIFFDYAKRL